MNRAERRRRTARTMRRRASEMKWAGLWPDLTDARLMGRNRTMSPFDCGRPQCHVCGKDRKPQYIPDTNLVD